MGSDLYSVCAVSRADASVTLDVMAIHPDVESAPPDPSFALLLLLDGAAADAPLAKKVPYRLAVKEPWMAKHAPDIVRAVRQVSAKGRRVKLAVDVTDPAWLAHVTKGARWESRAFQVVKYYEGPDDEVVMTPEPVPETPSDPDAFLWVPREAYEHSAAKLIGPLGIRDLPRLIQLPAYEAGAYTWTPEKPTPERIREWTGRAVGVSCRSGRPDFEGTVAFSADGHVSTFGLDDRAEHYNEVHKVKAIGLLRPVATGPRTRRLTYRRIFDALPSIVTSWNVDGATVVATLQVPPDGRDLAIESATDALELISRPARYSWGAVLIEELTEDVTARHVPQLGCGFSFEPNALGVALSEVAEKYIAAFSVEGHLPPPLPVDALDAMPSEEVRTLLERPWPTVTVRITATHLKWVRHLANHELAPVRNVASKPLPKPARRDPPAAPTLDERILLYVRNATSEKVWIAERFGASWRARWGRFGEEKRSERIYKTGSAEEARAAIAKTVAKKLKEGYQKAPSREEAAEVLWRRLNLAFDDTSGKLVVVDVRAPAHAIEERAFSTDELLRTWFVKGDVVERMSAGPSRHVATVEEAALLLEGFRSPRLGVGAKRRIGRGGVYTGVDIPLGD